MNVLNRLLPFVIVIGAAGVFLFAPGAQAEDKSTEGAKPPEGAAVLFDGKDLTGWTTREWNKRCAWKVENSYMEIVSGKGDIMTKGKFGPDFQLHVEFWLPKMPPEVKDQSRANSGVYLQGRYEIQVLDSYMNETYANGSVGSLYGIIAPDKKAQEKAVK